MSDTFTKSTDKKGPRNIEWLKEITKSVNHEGFSFIGAVTGIPFGIFAKKLSAQSPAGVFAQNVPTQISASLPYIPSALTHAEIFGLCAICICAANVVHNYMTLSTEEKISYPEWKRDSFISGFSKGACFFIGFELGVFMSEMLVQFINRPHCNIGHNLIANNGTVLNVSDPMCMRTAQDAAVQTGTYNVFSNAIIAGGADLLQPLVSFSTRILHPVLKFG